MSRRTQLLLIIFLVSIAAIVYWQSLTLRATTLPSGAHYTPADCWFEHSRFVRIECGYMTTRTNRQTGAHFELPVVVLRHSLWRNSKSPMLHIAGGPGGAAYLDSEVMEYWIQNFIDQSWGVDFVLYDQRGAGQSKPAFQCENTKAQRLQDLQRPLTSSEDSQHFSEQMQRCYDQLTQQNNTVKYLQSIGTDFSVTDIIDLHDSLMAEQWVLMGVSYGTRLALETARQYPGYVKSMILDSAYPPQFDGFESMVENGFKAVDRLLASCHVSEFCDEQFPMLSDQLYQALITLNKQPLSLNVPQGQKNKPLRKMTLSSHRLILLLDYASYDSDILAYAPAAIMAAWQRNPNDQALLKLASNYLDIELFDEFSEPVYLITECRENGRFDRNAMMQRIKEYRDEYPMLDWSDRAIFNASICDRWKDLSLSKHRNYREPINSDIPALVLAGSLDSITPPDWGRALAKQLSGSRYLEYPDAAHSVLTSSVCSNDEVQVFLNPGLSETAFCKMNERLAQRTHHAIDWSY